ncbi:hypothetical protein LTR47_009896 [Exophiala xenobiotica]|nr:hypothetical protein LTR47_009896 [Exophiala xenobiotica]KAK5243921.1 hypothetical protein LTS06_010397 [Exophiala xenobiotica]KAK5282195.1 hypothetical protein LTR40_003677 [Exophiala xenobiotica]KAK5361443.1 hypothetical protein LTS03_010396 [Exophiala xenobiotica]KAK5378745.1 hypothetical protein LTR11_004440 [Exophiala xenobiotica]
MAINLRSKIKQDTTLVICDANKAATEKFKSQMSGKGHIVEVETSAEAAKQSDLIITMLPAGPQVKSVYLDPTSGILAGSRGSRNKKLFIECGTIETTAILEVGKAVAESGLGSFVDSPVSGGPMGAEAGTLTFMVGSDEELFPQATGILAHMGKADNIFWCGPVGSGTAFKVINNYLSATTSVAASEALNIGVKMGLDPRRLTDVINVSAGQCWVTSHSNPVPGVNPNAPASRGYEGGFRIELCLHVFKMGVALAEMVGAKTVLSKPTLESLSAAAQDPKYRGKDARVIYKWLGES